MSTDERPTPASNLSTQLQEIERLGAFPTIPDSPEEEDAATGVLLSERIKRLCSKYRMIDPFDEKYLKAAAYELRVGDLYGIAGRIYSLKEGQTVTIQPYDVVVIQTLETLNLPRFLIARWNLRVKWAYKGLLWVGAAQVDAGYRGFLSCPLYNLSRTPVTVKFGEEIATIDFVPTSVVVPGQSQKYEWSRRSRIVFKDYVNAEDRLESALFELAHTVTEEVRAKTVAFEGTLRDFREGLDEQKSKVNEEIQKSQTAASQRAESVQGRVDSYGTTTFTVLAVLVAVLGIVVTRFPDSSYLSGGVFIGAIALWFALRAYYWASLGPGMDVSAKARSRRWVEMAIGVVLFVALVLADRYFSNGNLVEMRQLATANAQVERQTEDLQRRLTVIEASASAASEVAIRDEINMLRAQVDALRPKK